MENKVWKCEKTFLKKSQHYKTAGVEDTLVLNSNNRLQLHEAFVKPCIIIFYKNRDRAHLCLVQNYSGRGCGKKTGALGTQECDNVLRLERDSADLDLPLRKSALKNLTVALSGHRQDRVRAAQPVILYLRNHTGFRVFFLDTVRDWCYSQLTNASKLPSHRQDYLNIMG